MKHTAPCWICGETSDPGGSKCTNENPLKLAMDQSKYCWKSRINSIREPGATLFHLSPQISRGVIVHLFVILRGSVSLLMLHRLGALYISPFRAQLFAVWFGSTVVTAAMASAATTKPTSILEFQANDIDGNTVSLSKYKGFVTLIVNVASKWGFTDKNYKQLQELHTRQVSILAWHVCKVRL